LADLLKEQLKDCENISLLPSDSPIQSIIIKGNDEVNRVAALLQETGFDARPILSPTVAKGTERIRIALHSFNQDEEVIRLADAIKVFAQGKKQNV